jgi:hypothetical protein
MANEAPALREKFLGVLALNAVPPAAAGIGPRGLKAANRSTATGYAPPIRVFKPARPVYRIFFRSCPEVTKVRDVSAIAGLPV